MAWEGQISRDEFVVGWCHGVPASSQPVRRMARFRSRWSEFVITPSTDSELQRLLRDTFVPSGSDTHVDFGTEPLSIVTEFGRVVTVTPLHYAKTYIGPARPTTRLDVDADSDTESPSDILAVGFSRGRPLPSGIPVIAIQSPLPQLAPPVPRDWCILDSGSPEDMPVDQELPGARPRQHDVSTRPTQQPAFTQEAMMASLVALTQSTQQIAAATQQLLQQQGRDRQDDPSAPTQRHEVHNPSPRQPTTVSVNPSSEEQPIQIGGAQSTRHAGRRGQQRQTSQDRSRTPRHGRHDRSQSPLLHQPRGRSRSRDRDRPRGERDSRRHHYQHRSRSSEYRRDRSRDRGHTSRSSRHDHRPAPLVSGFGGYDDNRGDSSRWLEPGISTYYDSPHGRLPDHAMDLVHRSQSDNAHRPPRPYPPGRSTASTPPHRRNLDDRYQGQREFDTERRPVYQDTSEQSFDELLAGATSFRPPSAEVQVHQVARVGPRPNGTYSERALTSFWRLSLLDRVSVIQHHESLRNRYYVTKVTAKMLFSVNFGTRQLDHFLPPAQSGNERSVTHDPATWASADSSPVALISTIEDLRTSLYCIQEAASEWYPRPVAEVFRCVHSDSLDRLLDNAPRGLVCATINLYTHVFTSLFHAIREEYPAASLAQSARDILSHDSVDYRRLVRSVIDQALISTWARNQPPTVAQPRSQRAERRPRQRQSVPTQRRQNQAVGGIPTTIKAQIPVHENKPVCLRFQTVKGCDFTGCQKAHELVQLPPAVKSYLTEKHGDLKTGHPNLNA
eukprot:jgi/Phyca11/573857/estExt2_Genewise1.C_PHYCAscaffold_570139